MTSAPTASAQACATPVQAVPVAQFGKDHWSTLAYVETLCVDGQKGVGVLRLDRMRCNPDRHPLMGGAGRYWRPEYSTRLAGFFEFTERRDWAKAVAAGVMAENHDDWDCLDDLEAAGLVEVISLSQGTVRLTKEGIRVSALLREHKARGGQFATFKASVCEPEAA